MPNRLKSTLAGLTVWGLFMAGALMLGTPVERPAAPAVHDATPTGILAAGVSARSIDFRRNARLQLAMPYFSFGGLLPRQES